MATSNIIGPCYEPPFDSPIEELFAHNAVKYLDEECHFEKQVEVPMTFPTFGGRGRGRQFRPASNCSGLL